MNRLDDVIDRRGEGDFMVSLPLHHPCLADHIVRGKLVLPGVTYLELALAVAQRQYPRLPVVAFEDCVWLRPVVGEHDSVRVRVRLQAHADARIRFDFLDEVGSICSGWMSGGASGPGPWQQAADIWQRVTGESVRRYNRRQIYAEFSNMGIDYGRYFRRINYVDVHENQAVALLSNNDAVALSFSNLLDGAFQSGMAISIGTEAGSLMPFSLGMLVLHQPIDFKRTDSCFAVTEKSTKFRTNIAIHSEEGAPLVSVFDLGVKPSRL